MIRSLAQCPYCNRCEVALDDNPDLVLDPDGNPPGPCPHLAWVEGRYGQWERTQRGLNRVIGSTEFRWNPPEEGAAERTEQLLSYLKELVESGPDWPFAPAQAFVIRPLSAEEKATDPKGKAYTLWDVDGWAIFAADPAAFWAALPASREQWRRALDVGVEETS